MPDDLLEALSALCSACFGTGQVAYCAAWEAYLCDGCRDVRSGAETRVTLAAKAAMQAEANEEAA